MPLPLEGIRVIDMTVVWAGPFGGALLSDLGAEVIRVESAQRWDRNIRIAGDPELIAHVAPEVEPDAPALGDRLQLQQRRAQPASVTMDLTRPEGREVSTVWPPSHDIFIENNTPDLMDHLGIATRRCPSRNPKLIMVSLSGLRCTGPYSPFRAFGSNMEAMSAMRCCAVTPIRTPPEQQCVFSADACRRRHLRLRDDGGAAPSREDGPGQFIDMSQSENVAQPSARPSWTTR